MAAEIDAGNRARTSPIPFARIAWAIVTLLILTVMAIGLPLRYSELRTVCTQAPCSQYDYEQMTETGLRSLEALGLSINFYAAYSIALSAAGSLASLVVGAILAWRGSSDRAAAVFAILLPLTTIGPLPIHATAWIFSGVAVLQAASVLLFLTLFPSGHFVPRWVRWLVPVWLAINITRLIPASPLNSSEGLDALQWFGTFFIALGSQVYRYLRVSRPIERQQIKWLVTILIFGFTAATGLFLLQPTNGSLLFLVDRTLNSLIGLSIPLTVGLAILRYRLWEIDLIIRKTLVYAAITGLLALIYLSGVTLLQNLFVVLSDQHSTAAIVISTLVIAALFNPLRRQVQDFIDRRFYRRKYDAEKILAVFAATARDEVDIERFARTLLSAVEETMQPVHTSLWFSSSPLHPAPSGEAVG